MSGFGSDPESLRLVSRPIVLRARALGVRRLGGRVAIGEASLVRSRRKCARRIGRSSRAKLEPGFKFPYSAALADGLVEERRSLRLELIEEVVLRAIRDLEILNLRLKRLDLAYKVVRSSRVLAFVATCLVMT